MGLLLPATIRLPAATDIYSSKLEGRLATGFAVANSIDGAGLRLHGHRADTGKQSVAHSSDHCQPNCIAVFGGVDRDSLCHVPKYGMLHKLLERDFLARKDVSAMQCANVRDWRAEQPRISVRSRGCGHHASVHMGMRLDISLATRRQNHNRFSFRDRCQPRNFGCESYHTTARLQTQCQSARIRTVKLTHYLPAATFCKVSTNKLITGLSALFIRPTNTSVFVDSKKWTLFFEKAVNCGANYVVECQISGWPRYPTYACDGRTIIGPVI